MVITYKYWQATTGGGLHHQMEPHTFVANQDTAVVMSSLLNYSVGLGAVRLMLYDC